MTYYYQWHMPAESVSKPRPAVTRRPTASASGSQAPLLVLVYIHAQAPTNYPGQAMMASESGWPA
jgi:hypothetical protein